MPDRKPTRAEAVRSAVDEAFSAAAGQAQTTTRRAQELVDELTQVAGRVQQAVDDLRPAGADEVRALRREVRALAERVAKLEQGARSAPEGRE
jgi:polyhydroxyalkanoate synthesis regulator phasin